MNAIGRMIDLEVNGRPEAFAVNPGRRLSDVLRYHAQCLDVKSGCDAGDCGACTILLDGEPVCACLMPVVQARGRRVTTLKGLDDKALQAAFLQHGAAQCGICTPGMIMAAKALLKRNKAPERSEIEDAIGGVLCRCTGYRKIVDAIAHWASVAGPASTAPGPVGQSIERLDGLAKVDGSEVYGADHLRDGYLLLRAIRSPYPSASFSFGDLNAWQEAHPGVERIITASDIEGRNAFGVIPPLADQPALADGIARFKGEAAAIVAGRPDIVEALNLESFPVEWQPGEELSCPAQAVAKGAPLVHSSRIGNLLIEGRVATCDEPVHGENIVHREIETSFVEHAYIEPEAGIAWMDGTQVVVAACTQAPVMDRDDLALLLGLEKERVRVIPTAAGGGFGSKLDLSLQPFLALAAKLTGKPCRMVYGRRESMESTTKRHPARIKASVSADRHGHIQAMRFEGDFDTGAYASWGPTVANRVPIHASGPYRIPHYRAEARAIHTNNPISGAFRGFGVPQAAIIQETAFDLLAQKLRLDALEFRKRNVLRDGDRTVFGQELETVGILECLEALTPYWKSALGRAAGKNERSGPIRHGAGLASCWYGCGNTSLPNPSTVLVGITSKGGLRLHQGAVDIGQGANTVITQICAQALGLPVEQFELIGADTDLTPDCGKTSASRQTFVTGNAAKRAGEVLRQQILRHFNLAASAELSLTDGLLVARDGNNSGQITLSEMPCDKRGYVLSAQETYDPPTTSLNENGQGRPYAVYGYGAQIAEVAVDTELGTVKVEHIVAAHDLGRAINPQLAIGQIEGGIAQGLGMALMEEYVPGRTENLHDYLIPTVGDMPKITSILVEKPDPEGPFGAKGLGEHVLIPTAPAILNAIRHACAADITHLPALPHRVLAAIEAARG